jgi:hypothetical protein
MRTIAIVALSAFLVTWAVYRFSHAPIRDVTTVPDRAAGRIFGEGSGMARLVRATTSHVQLPAPELLDGVRMMRQQRNEGTSSYLLGHVKEQGGWWYFFIVALAVKTPLAALILAAVGTFAAGSRYLRDRSGWEIVTPIAAAAMILVVTAPSGLNSGVRYVMPMFALFSILAGFGLVNLWKAGRHTQLCRTLAILLFAWLAISSLRAHPDYLAYFNEFGGSDPSRILVISDLDWGQDLTRLATYLREKQIDHISIAYEGFYDPASLGLPETVKLKCGDVPTGWVAVAARRARRSPECEPWLAGQQRIEIVGKTMWIYHLPETQPPQNPPNPVH